MSKQPEARLWQRIKKGMAPYWAAHRHEDAQPGVPDVSYSLEGVGGWIELKRIMEYPKRPGTAVRVPHFSIEQRVWLRKTARHNPRVFVLMQVAQDFFLFGPELIERVGGMTRADMIDEADKAWVEVPIDFVELATLLKGEPLEAEAC